MLGIRIVFQKKKVSLHQISITKYHKDMKAFIFDLVNKLQRTSNTLDAKVILCNKTWRVFSDTGEKEVYIFMEDGKLVIASNGKVDMGTWMYIPANQSLVITGKQNYLVHPVICNNILALVVDGTNQCAFLLDDTKRELEAVKSLQSISSYISSNINKLPALNNIGSANIPTANNVPILGNQNNNYCFGILGDRDGDVGCNVDLRQLKRISGQFARAKFSCDIVNPSDIFLFHAYSSDAYKNEYNLVCATFDICLCRGELNDITYRSQKTTAGAHIYIFEKSILGFNKKFKKTLNYYKASDCLFGTDQLDAKTWLNLYGDELQKDINRYKEELTSILGVSDIYSLFVEWRNQIW